MSSPNSIETNEEKEMLHKMGYNIYQGYLYSAAKPLLSPIAENEKTWWRHKMKYFVLSIDDGTVFDAKTIAILNRLGLHATFNLNSGLDDFVWYKDGFPIRRRKLSEN
ncbi:MAG: hypothetical protein II467_03790, partial [Bacilli bacterium]|nr:hypothetical protein [Bacilli bacterium]